MVWPKYGSKAAQEESSNGEELTEQQLQLSQLWVLEVLQALQEQSPILTIEG